MYYYQILPETKSFQRYLTYSFTENLNIGQIVKIPLRNKECLGLVVGIHENIEFGFDLSKVKEVLDVLPYKWSDLQLKYFYSLSQNTFNQINIVLNSFLNPIQYLNQKQWKLLQNVNKDINKQNTQFLENIVENRNNGIQFILDIDILLRIIYIIRSTINTSPENNVLIIFPEKKYLDKIYQSYKEMVKKSVGEQLPCIKRYNAEKSKASNELIYNLMTTTGNIVWSTRAGLFLPFSNLDQIVVVDESNGFYIQDQNGLYYDARDVAVIMANAYNAKLYFISPLPSVRLASLYSLDDL